MSELDGMRFSNDQAVIEAVAGPTGIVVKFAGVIDDLNPGTFMDPLLDRLHTHLLAQRHAVVVADITELDVLNSNGIKSIIKWVVRQTGLRAEQRYQIKFLYSMALSWQHTCLKAITYVAKGTVITEAVE